MDWFKHDTDAHDDIKIRKLMKSTGFIGYGAYWYIVELLYNNGGQLSDQEIYDEMVLMGLTEEQALALSAEMLDLGLFTSTDGDHWISARVQKAMDEANSIRERMSQLGKKGAEARYSVRQAHAKRTPSARQAAAIARVDKNRGDYTDSSSYKNTPRLIRNNNNNSKLGETHDVPASQSEPGTVPPAPSAVITIQNNRGEEVPINQQDVLVWEQTYPAVDIMGELRKMKAWSLANPQNRKTTQGMPRFINRWLSKAQDEARRVPDYSRGISLIADGTRAEHPEEKVVFE